MIRPLSPSGTIVPQLGVQPPSLLSPTGQPGGDIFIPSIVDRPPRRQPELSPSEFSFPFSPARAAIIGSALLFSGCVPSEVKDRFFNFVQNLTAPEAALISAAIVAVLTVGVQPLLRAAWDVYLRATPGATRRAAEGAILQAVHMAEAVERLVEKDEEKIRKAFLYDLVDMEREKLRKGVEEPILGRGAEIGAIFDSFLMGQTGLALTGAPNNGATTLIRGVAREVAKLERGEKSLCPPAWKGGRLYSIRFDRLLALESNRRYHILLAVLAIGRKDPQRVKLVIDNRPYFAGVDSSAVTAFLFDAIQRSRIGVVLAMNDDSFDRLVKEESPLAVHLARLKIPRLSDEEIYRMLLSAFQERLVDLRRLDPDFQRLTITFLPEDGEGDDYFLRILFNATESARSKGDLRACLSLVNEFAVYIYRLGRSLRVSGDLARSFLDKRRDGTADKAG